MRSWIAIGVAVLVLASCATVETSNDATKPAEPEAEAHMAETKAEFIDISGTWKGDLVVGSRKIPFVWHVSITDDGEYSATLDSPSEGAYGIPVESVSVDGMNVVFSIPVTSAKYEAVYDADADRMAGAWKQAGGSFDLDIERTEDEEAVVRKPQEPVPPYPYHSTEAAFRNEAAGITLKGTITYPDGSGPFPGVVLISGSGQQNRDEEVFGHKPFLVLADRLTRAGIVVLRYDDRGAGESEGAETLKEASSRDFGEDAYAAYNFLRSLQGIDRERIGLIGHSEGGMIAPALAAEHPEIAFVVLLAGPGVPGKELLVSQSAAMLEASGAPQATVNMAIDANSRTYQAILDNPNDEDAAAAVTTILKEVGLNQTQIDAQLETLLSPWYRYFLAYDPAPALESLDIPVLALNGTLDLQVPYEANLDGIRGSLEMAPTTDFRLEALENLNHMFQTATTGLVAEYGELEETFSPVALDLIAEWITEVVR